GELRQLRSLSLFNNQLQHLPEALRQCIALKELYLHENPDLSIPAEILGPTLKEKNEGSGPANPAEILDYYFRPKRPLLEAKLILVGRGAVGKTSLVNRLVHNTFGKEKKTEGIRITRWDVPLPNGEQAHLNVWDFGGQEIMHATHQFFLTRRSLYLLVLSGREGSADQDAEYWLKMIESFSGESPVLVVLNKQREHPCEVNQRQLQGKYPFIRGFLRPIAMIVWALMNCTTASKTKSTRCRTCATGSRQNGLLSKIICPACARISSASTNTAKRVAS